MPMLVEAALVTRKAKGSDFNTDSINASGKIWPRERIHSDGGVFAAGRGQNTPYYVMSAAKTKGTAESAVQLYNECAATFNDDCTNVSEMTSEFFRSFISFLGAETHQASDTCTIAAFVGHGDRVYLAKSGKTKMFRINGLNISEVVPQYFDHSDGKSQYGVCCFPEVTPGEIFVLLNSGVSAVLTNDVIEKACSACENDVQKLLRKLANAAVAADAGVSVTLMAVKVLETEAIPVPVAVPVTTPVNADEQKSADGKEEEPQTENTDAPGVDAVLNVSPDADETDAAALYAAKTVHGETDSVGENSEAGTENGEASTENSDNLSENSDLSETEEDENADVDGNDYSKKRSAIIVLAVALTVAVLVLMFLVVRGFSTRFGNNDETSTFESTSFEESSTAQENVVTTTPVTTEASDEVTTVSTETTTAHVQVIAPVTSTEAPTEAPTDEATEAPTDEATEAPTDEATHEPTESETAETTDVFFEEPTDETTETPTQDVTDESTAASSEASENTTLSENEQPENTEAE